MLRVVVHPTLCCSVSVIALVNAALVAFVKHIAYISTILNVLTLLTLLTQITLDKHTLLWKNMGFLRYIYKVGMKNGV